MLGKHLTLRQRVFGTACDCHSLLQAILHQELALQDRPFYRDSWMLLFAAKAEKSPVHIKHVVSESRIMFSRTCTSALLSSLDLNLRMCRGGLQREELSLGQLKACRDGVLARMLWSRKQEKSASVSTTVRDTGVRVRGDSS